MLCRHASCLMGILGAAARPRHGLQFGIPTLNLSAHARTKGH